MLSRALAVTTAVPQIGGPPRKPVMTSVRSNLFRLLPARLDQLQADRRRANRIRFVQEAAPVFHDKWHWFAYHFSHLPPTPFGQSLMDACIGLERIKTGRGLIHLLDIAKIG